MESNLHILGFFNDYECHISLCHGELVPFEHLYLKIEKTIYFFFEMGLGKWKYISLSYFVPALLVLISYLFNWSFSFGGLPNGQMILDWAEELGLAGIGTLSPTYSVIVAVILLGIVGLIRAMATKRLRLHNLITFLKNK